MSYGWAKDAEAIARLVADSSLPKGRPVYDADGNRVAYYAVADYRGLVVFEIGTETVCDLPESDWVDVTDYVVGTPVVREGKPIPEPGPSPGHTSP